MSEYKAGALCFSLRRRKEALFLDLYIYVKSIKHRIMKKIISIPIIVCFLAACHTTGQMSAVTGPNDYGNADTSITQSLFNDKGSTISEEGIQKILEGNYKLPSSLR